MILEGGDENNPLLDVNKFFLNPVLTVPLSVNISVRKMFIFLQRAGLLWLFHILHSVVT
jgi:hypothetical protein